jgi:DNA polymerase/3'-5' exonuclease PolX
MTYIAPTNQEIGVVLNDIADLLEVQHASPFKISAYRTGAKYVKDRPDSIAKIVFSGDGQALQTLPNIGESLAAIIEEYVKTGKSQVLNRLQGEVPPEDIFGQVPGIGEELAERIVKILHIKTLEELEQAAHDLGKTHDWVVIFFEQNGFEGQSTVVTETSGPLMGRRVVRGREPKCMLFYFL